MDDKVNAFFNKYNGIGVNFDQAYGNQCVDLIEQYNKEVVGAPRLGIALAKDLWTNYPQQYYDRIANDINDPNSYPHLGDIIVFDYGSAGHVDICKSANYYSIIGFDQNWPLQGYYDKNGNFIGTGSCHLQAHNYISDKVLGWLRPKSQDPLTQIKSIINSQISDADFRNQCRKILGV